MSKLQPDARLNQGWRRPQVGKAPRDNSDDLNSARVGTGTDSHALAADDGLQFVLPYGSTLTVQKPAVAILSSGKIAYPMHRPVAAVWEKKNAGKIAVIGSAQIFEDSWLVKEENDKLMEFIMRWLTPGNKIKLYNLDAEEPDVIEYQHLPDTEALAERLRCCLQACPKLYDVAALGFKYQGMCFWCQRLVRAGIVAFEQCCILKMDCLHL